MPADPTIEVFEGAETARVIFDEPSVEPQSPDLPRRLLVRASVAGGDVYARYLGALGRVVSSVGGRFTSRPQPAWRLIGYTETAEPGPVPRVITGGGFTHRPTDPDADEAIREAMSL